MPCRPCWLAACLLFPLPVVLAQAPGSFVDAGDTQVSAMMMFLGNEEKVYILDKSEKNEAQIQGHPAWGAVWDIATHTATLMDIATNTYCAAGMHLPNGSYATFGGNAAVGPNAQQGDIMAPDGLSAADDTTYEDADGRKSIRILNPCTGDSNDFESMGNCSWYDDPSVLSMQATRWYAAAEPLGDGSVAIIGGFTQGGYVNRFVPNEDPTFENGYAVPTVEFFPSKGDPQIMDFLRRTSGLNAYAHTYLVGSGKMLVQANYSTILWDPANNTEEELPDMPGRVIRVYPGSAAVAMLPLTPANDYTPTVLFCGGSDLPPDAWGNYTYPFVDTFDIPASPDCQRLTPEPPGGAPVAYEQDDDMLVGRTMGQFIHLPDQTMLVINGAANGTAGYSAKGTLNTPPDQMPFDSSLASAPVLSPAIYNPNAPAGQRWSDNGLQLSSIPRMYHSTALLLPDTSVLVAGSNPNLDVNTSAYFPTTYTAEIFYPPYFAAPVRPDPTGMPTRLTYGGAPFDVVIPPSSYSGPSNDAAQNTKFQIIRPGWTTHAMNMGQRSMELNTTFTVISNGTIILHVAQPPPNPNLIQPGPVLMFVVMSGIPSYGKMAIVGNGRVEIQPILRVTPLPDSILEASATGTAAGSKSTNGTDPDDGNGQDGSDSGSPDAGPDGADDDNEEDTTPNTPNTGAIVGGAVAAAVTLGVLLLAGLLYARSRRRRTNTIHSHASTIDQLGSGSGSGAGGSSSYAYGVSGARGMQPDMRNVEGPLCSFAPPQYNAMEVAPSAPRMSMDGTPFDDPPWEEEDYVPYNGAGRAPRQQGSSSMHRY